RHKKRELKFLRAALARRLRALRPRPGGRGSRAERSLLGRALSGIGGPVAGLLEAAPPPPQERRPPRPAHIEREIHAIDETLHNIEGCILQLQGKLLTLG